MTKNKFTVNELPQLIQEGKITKKQAVDFLAEEVLRAPYHYGINLLDEEALSELSLRILQNSYFLFDHYKADCGKFSTYFCSFLKFQIMSIKRDFINDVSKDKTLKNIQEQELEYSQIDNNSEDSKKLVTLTACNLSQKEKAPYIRKSDENLIESIVEQSDWQNIMERTHFEKLMTDRRNSQKFRKIVLVLALKYSYYLHEIHIKNISEFCEINEDELFNIINAICKSLKTKSRKVEKQIQRRDYLYYLHKKYLQKLQETYVSESRICSYRKLYDLHTKKWTEKNQSFEKNAIKICPSNKTIAKILGICERQVGYYLNHAMTISEIDFLKKDLAE